MTSNSPTRSRGLRRIWGAAGRRSLVRAVEPPPPPTRLMRRPGGRHPLPRQALRTPLGVGRMPPTG
eukprot:6115507-Alexandrium_andersonii.AAC.1